MSVRGNWKIDLENGLFPALGELDSLVASYMSAKKKKPVKKKVKAKQKGGDKTKEYVYDWSKCICGMAHPPVPNFKPSKGNKCTFYSQVAELFPLMTLHRLLSSEIRFIEADTDMSGVLEVEEVIHVLQYLMGTGLHVSEIEKAFDEIDEDNSGTLDFIEVLSVVDCVIQRRAMDNVSEPIIKALSKVCTIQ